METKTSQTAANPSIIEGINLYSIVRDVIRNLWAIVLGAIAVAMLVNTYTHSKIDNTYTTKALFVVTSRTSGNYAYSNLNAATTAATSYSNILNSSLLKKKVCEDLGV